VREREREPVRGVVDEGVEVSANERVTAECWR
jgi:hypothetical protein